MRSENGSTDKGDAPINQPVCICFVCTHCQRVWLDDPQKQYCGCHPDAAIEECVVPWKEIAVEAQDKLNMVYQYARGEGMSDDCDDYSALSNDYEGHKLDERVQLIHDVAMVYHEIARWGGSMKMAKAGQLAGTVVVIAGAIAAVGAAWLVIAKLIAKLMALWT